MTTQTHHYNQSKPALRLLLSLEQPITELRVNPSHRNTEEEKFLESLMPEIEDAIDANDAYMMLMGKFDDQSISSFANMPTVTCAFVIDRIDFYECSPVGRILGHKPFASIYFR